SREKWSPFISELEAQGLKPVFLSLPGFGEKELSSPWSVDDYVNWLLELLPKDEKVVLLGHSFGGHIAVTFAELYPERVEKLILISSSGLREHALKSRLKRKVFSLAAKLGKKLTSSEQLRGLLYKLAREKDYLSASPVMRETMKLAISHDVTLLLAQVEAKTCLIWGENDAVTPLSLGKVFDSQIKNSTLHILPGERHSPQFTAASGVARIVGGFLREDGEVQ
ncbi:MAG: alpha/beta hydrolase, partial [Candidatus Pacebacteria bacterium]|nr:alpha/beta hydrolase [Candidatus Paceibacterota bacterium]